MNHRLPDWMLAAFAIGGWELARLISTKWQWPWAWWISYGIIAVCVLVLGIRYITRWVQRRRHPPAEDPNAWKDY